ncbi:hypothetical protein PX699_22270 [Sphingobium sp. H39-3-25]|uniref:hypothetical protein n=1 Tax=Sphingobium arseniciresistens TaxID=3030834 RepID=UPI0023B8F037|nr:hypothetical protein [Sphingobium arseniciresistens]
MSFLSDQHVIAAWEGGRTATAPERARLLLALLGDADAAENMSVGERDRRFIAVLAEGFGRDVEAVADCAACGAIIEIGFDALAFAEACGPVGEASVTLASGDTHNLRLPTTRDIIASQQAGDPAGALAQSCLAHQAGAPLTPGDVERVGQALVAADPLLDPVIATSCPECGTDQQVSFDAAAFLWDRMATRARNLLTQVHLLARAYGWSEDAILALPERRRASYVDMVMG